MLKQACNFFWNSICEDDAHTQVDPIILSMFAVLAGFIAYAGYQAVTHPELFDPVKYGMGGGSILGGGGAGKFAKAKADAQ